MTGPLVSVVIPTKNRCDLIGETLQSVAAQSFREWECIVVDDGSTDQTAEVVSSFTESDGRFKYIINESGRSGAPVARNIGFKNGIGKYVLFLDSDDLIAVECLEERVRLCEGEDLDFAACLGEIFQKEIGDVGLLVNVWTRENELDRQVKMECIMITAACLWRRSFLEENGIMWDEELVRDQDADFVLRGLCHQPAFRLSWNVDFFWREHGSSRVSSNEDAIRKLASRWRYCTKAEKLLEEKGLMSERRSQLLAFLYFNLTTDYLTLTRRAEARKAWKESCRLGAHPARMRWIYLAGRLLTRFPGCRKAGISFIRRLLLFDFKGSDQIYLTRRILSPRKHQSGDAFYGGK